LLLRSPRASGFEPQVTV
jgi:hypothetical protein